MRGRMARPRHAPLFQGPAPTTCKSPAPPMHACSTQHNKPMAGDLMQRFGFTPKTHTPAPSNHAWGVVPTMEAWRGDPVFRLGVLRAVWSRKHACATALVATPVLRMTHWCNDWARGCSLLAPLQSQGLAQMPKLSAMPSWRPLAHGHSDAHSSINHHPMELMLPGVTAWRRSWEGVGECGTFCSHLAHASHTTHRLADHIRPSADNIQQPSSAGSANSAKLQCCTP